MIKCFTSLGCILLFLVGSATAQITVSSSTLPAVGDTLRLAIDNLPQGIDPGQPGGDKSWIYSSLQAPFVDEVIIRPPSAGQNSSAFPNATYFTNPQDNVENYYTISNGKLFNRGFAGELPVLPGIEAIARYSGSGLEERSTPLSYMDQSTHETDLRIPFSTEILPDTLLADLPIQPDSIRLSQNIRTSSVVDAWGEMALPDGFYPCLRQRNTVITTNQIEIKAGFLPWFPLPAELEIPGLSGIDTSLNYTFYSNLTKEPLAILAMAENGTTVNSVIFKADDRTITNAYDRNVQKADVFAYPNPAVGSVRFDMIGLPQGRYTLKLYNILGVDVWSKQYNINSNTRTVRVDLDNINRGTYLYSLINADGRVMVTKRLIVLRP